MKLIPSGALIVGGAALALGIGGGIAVADIPSSSDGTISACRIQATGVLRVINAEAGATCKKGEVPLEWNQQGVPGKDGQDAAAATYYGAHGGGGALVNPGVWVATSFCEPGDGVIGVYDMQVVDGTTVWQLDITHNAGGNEGYRLQIEGPAPSGFVTPLCLDVNGDEGT
jgi:hypothetical protein